MSHYHYHHTHFYRTPYILPHNHHHKHYSNTCTTQDTTYLNDLKKLESQSKTIENVFIYGIFPLCIISFILILYIFTKIFCTND